MSEYDWRAELLEALNAWKAVIPELPSFFMELKRKQRHHDVLCLVLKELLRAHAPITDDKVYAACTQDSRLIADLVYPPPKEPEG